MNDSKIDDVQTKTILEDSYQVNDERKICRYHSIFFIADIICRILMLVFVNVGKVRASYAMQTLALGLIDIYGLTF